MLESIPATLAWFNLSGPELLIILVVALLLFGSRLPSVGRSLGKGITEFKKGIKGIEDEIENAATSPPNSNRSLTDGANEYRQQDERRVSRNDAAEVKSNDQA